MTRLLLKRRISKLEAQVAGLSSQLDLERERYHGLEQVISQYRALLKDKQSVT